MSSNVATSVGIVGASGYSGMVLTRLLAQHPRARVQFATSDKWQGRDVGSAVGTRLPHALSFVANGAALEAAKQVELVFLATSAEVSAALTPELLARGTRVIDLSGAFRLRDAAAYPRWYRLEHPAPDLLARAHYGLPELSGAPTGPLVANPGCYPTAAALFFAPLLRAGLIQSEGLICDAKSGVTGAGRKASEDYSFAEIDQDLRAYKLFTHQHTPEIAQTIGAPLTFTAQLLPIKRGILETCYARARAGVTGEQLRDALRTAYEGRRFVRVMDPHEVTLGRVVGTNDCHLGVAAHGDVVIGVAAIDNLLKGAAGQAVQNFNLMYGLDEAIGLSHLSPIAP